MDSPPPAPLTSERIAATLPQAGSRGLLRGQRRIAFPRGRYGSPFFLLSLLQLGAQIGRAEYKPPLTLGVMALHAATFLRPDLCLRWLLRPGARITDVALHPAAFWEGGLKPLQKARQLILSAATHREPFHLYWNAVTFFWQGSTLEARLGSKAFGKLIGTLLLTSHSIFVAGSWLLACIGIYGPYEAGVHWGFSSVLFALKVRPAPQVNAPPPSRSRWLTGAAAPRRW